MALIEMDFINGGGGGDIQIVWSGVSSSQYSSAHIDTFTESADMVLVSYADSAVLTENMAILKPSDSVTFQTTGGRATTTNISFASDGQSISWTKNTAYGSVYYFAIKVV